MTTNFVLKRCYPLTAGLAACLLAGSALAQSPPPPANDNPPAAQPAPPAPGSGAPRGLYRQPNAPVALAPSTPRPPQAQNPGPNTPANHPQDNRPHDRHETHDDRSHHDDGRAARDNRQDWHSHNDWHGSDRHEDWHGSDRHEDRHGYDHREDWRGPSHSGVAVYVGQDPYYTQPAPYYVPAPAPYYYPTPRRSYYYSSYYAQRAIPVETAQPYVEIRCTGQPITGTVVGGVAGGLIGNQFGHGGGRAAATIGGALLGAIIGQGVDRANESCAYQALEYAQPDTQVVWADPRANYSYTVTPGPVTTSQDGRYCREYQAKILVGDELQDGYGRACRQPDGSWEMVE